MNTVTKPMYKWQDIEWKKIERNVFKLQKRIFQASSRGDVKTVRKLQRLITRSWSAKLLATRKVTQDNQGKKTAGIDGVKQLSPPQRIELVSQLRIGQKAKPVRRVWIPKPGSEEKRPLGIPVMQDRVIQALVKMALEPQWEAKFEANSYGFRPGRSCWDAIAALHIGLHSKAKWVLDADIAKCYDRINHQALLSKLNTSPKLRRQIKAWLKAGVMDGMELFPTKEGVPQGGVISPLLANIALDGMEEILKQHFPEKKHKNFPTPILIRYADDFVIMHKEREVVEKCQEIICKWLTEMGLELKPSKTKIVHSLKKQDVEVGFDFLGFNIRQYEVGRTKSGYDTHGNKLGFKTIIKPSKEALKKHQEKLREIIDQNKASKQQLLIMKLNPVIRGWSNYYSKVASTNSFNNMDMLLIDKLKAWAYRRHSQKGKKWIVRKYWGVKDKWEFKDKENQIKLKPHNQTPIKRHIKVQGKRSPYDGDYIYWSNRLSTYPGTSTRVSNLLKRQKGQCLYCELYFRYGDILEVDHIISKEMGGADAYRNWQLLHRHCHDQKTAKIAGGMHDKH